MSATHQWNDEQCSCGSDTCVCQGCGKIVCGATAIWKDGAGNVGPCCLAKFGMGHAGTEPVGTSAAIAQIQSANEPASNKRYQAKEAR